MLRLLSTPLNTIVLYVAVGSTLLFAQTASTMLPAPVAQQQSINLDCYNIPNHSQQLCILATDSALHPVDDLVFFRLDDLGYLTMLRAEFGDVANIWIHGFSAGGKYTIMGYAEEGHPSYVVYPTERVLSSGYSLDPVAVISDYYIVNLLHLDDDGSATVEYGNGTACQTQSEASYQTVMNIFE